MNNTIDCINPSSKIPRKPKGKKFTRPGASKKTIDISDLNTPKKIKREKSGNINVGYSKSKLHTIQEYRTARKQRNSSLSTSFNQSGLNALDVLRSKNQRNSKAKMETSRMSYDTENFSTLRTHRADPMRMS